MSGIILKKVNRDRLTAFLMLLPSIILLGIFVYGFIGQTLYSSLTDWEGLGEIVDLNFVGLKNYRELFTGLLDVRFRQSLVNTFYFTAFFIGGCLGMGLILAILLDQIRLALDPSVNGIERQMKEEGPVVVVVEQLKRLVRKSVRQVVALPSRFKLRQRHGGSVLATKRVEK